jgi:hypothetical protein
MQFSNAKYKKKKKKKKKKKVSHEEDAALDRRFILFKYSE